MVKKAAPPAASTTPTPVEAAAALAAIQRSDDPLDYTLRCVQAIVPEFGPHLPIVKSYLEQQLALTKYQQDLRDRNQRIRRDHQQGASYPLLERRYGLSYEQLWRIVNGLQRH